MDNAGKIKDMRAWLSICLIYAIIVSFYGLDSSSDFAIILLAIQFAIGYLSWKILYLVTHKKRHSIIIGVVSSFTFINIFTILYILRKANDYLNSGLTTKEVHAEEDQEIYNEEDNVFASFKSENEKRSSKKAKKNTPRISVFLNIILFICVGALSVSLSDKDYQISNLEDKIVEYKDIIVKYEDTIHSTSVLGFTSKVDNLEVVDIENDSNLIDFEKVVVSGHAMDKSNPFMLTVTGTITNNGVKEHSYDVQVIFYDKSNNPIALENDNYNSINPGDISGFEVTLLNNIENVNSYEIKLLNRDI